VCRWIVCIGRVAAEWRWLGINGASSVAVARLVDGNHRVLIPPLPSRQYLDSPQGITKASTVPITVRRLPRGISRGVCERQQIQNGVAYDVFSCRPVESWNETRTCSVGKLYMGCAYEKGNCEWLVGIGAASRDIFWAKGWQSTSFLRRSVQPCQGIDGGPVGQPASATSAPIRINAHSAVQVVRPWSRVLP